MATSARRVDQGDGSVVMLAKWEYQEPFVKLASGMSFPSKVTVETHAEGLVIVLEIEIRRRRDAVVAVVTALSIQEDQVTVTADRVRRLVRGIEDRAVAAVAGAIMRVGPVDASTEGMPLTQLRPDGSSGGTGTLADEEVWAIDRSPPWLRLRAGDIERGKAAPVSRRGRGISDEQLRAVAEIFRQERKKARKVVAERYGVGYRTVSRWRETAIDRGLLQTRDEEELDAFRRKAQGSDLR